LFAGPDAAHAVAGAMVPNIVASVFMISSFYFVPLNSITYKNVIAYLMPSCRLNRI
jgi:hypothetical protein